ncbi:MAG TPA: general stress protein CsbD [Burkholderiaceae bacterium]
MNRDHFIGRLKQFNGKIKEQWCALHDDQIGIFAAKRYQIAGRQQAQCGIAQKESAQRCRTFSAAQSWCRYNPKETS